jgi:diguanylate cyclase (GGDEF)-like protein
VQPRRRGGRPGVAARILVLALVPVVGVGVALTLLVQSGRDRLASSSSVSAQIDQLRDMAELHRAMTTERLMTVGAINLDHLGIDSEFLATEFGVVPDEVITRAQATIAGCLDALAADGVFDAEQLADRLGDLRAAAAAPGADARAIAGRFDTLIDEVGALIDHERLAGAVNEATVTRPLGASMSTLHAAIDAYRFGALQLSSVADVWFSTEATRQAAVVAVAKNTAQFDRAMRLVLASGDPAIAEWSRVLESPEVGAFDRAVANALRGAAPESATLDSIVDAFSGVALRQDALGDLVDVTADAAEAEAGAAHDDAVATTQRLTVIGIVVAAVTTALAIWAARSISRPLRHLIERTEQIRDGDLSPDERPLTGPYDLRLAAATVEQLVDNLRLLGAKSVALSRYDLDDPVLEEELPGALGDSLQQSTRVLRESIAAREELQQRLWHAAHHDSLTGIANRSAAIDALRTELARPGAASSVVVLFIDLDGFKRVNDAHGHAVGDELLQTAANRMRAVVRPNDTVGRIGGDEFMVVLTSVARGEGALSTAERLLEAVRQPVEIGDARVCVGASIGVAFAAPGERPSDLLARADLAVYQAKQNGTSIHVYDEALHREIQQRTTIERDLADALQRDGELELHFQPIVDAYTGEMRRAEALLRWNRPGHGLVGPDVFIPAAEASTLIVDVDRWVLRAALAQAAAWSSVAGREGLGISINISGRHLLADTFVPTVAEALRTSGVDPRRVTVELTESVLLDDLDRAAAHLAAVRDLGVSVHVDDFGTGYTSIAHLHALPIDGIKIDRRFVGALPGARELTLVRTLVELGLQLGLSVIAEGVETDEQQTIVQSLGCEAVQGYLVGRPCPAGEFDARFSPAAADRC